MFISHFNRYFEKHAKLTYLVLLIIIIATFVIFVTPGSMQGGRGGLKDFGKMYGKTLSIDTVQKEMNKTTLGLWISNPSLFGADFSSQKQALFNEALNRMRLLHYAKQNDLDQVTDDEIKARIATIEALKDEDGHFNKVAFENMIDIVKRNLQLVPTEFDEVVKEDIIIERVLDKVKERAVVSDADVDDAMAQYTLKCATVGISTKDAQPTEEEIQKFYAERKAEIVLPESKNALAAVFRYDAVRAAMGASAVPSAAEIAQRYEANKNTVYKDQTLEQATEAIRAALTDERVRAEARKKAQALSNEFKTLVQDEATEARVARYRAAAEKAGAAVSATGVIALDNMIEGLGNQERLADVIRNTAAVGDVTPMIIGDGFTAVAMVTFKQATQMPDSLPELKENGMDALRTIISATISNEKALAFFQEKVKNPYDAYMAAVEAIRDNKSMDSSSKQQALYELGATLDQQLIGRFYVPEQRSFGQVTFAPEGYLSQVADTTAEEVAAAFEARKAEFEADKKVLDDVKEGLANDLKAAKARKLADEAAAQFAEKFGEAWWKAQDANAKAQSEEEKTTAVALMEKLAGEIAEAKFEVVNGLDVSHVTAANSEVLRAAFMANMTSPISSAVIGLDASYVICLTGIEAAHLADPAAKEYNPVLLQAYRENVEMAAAQARAQAEMKRIAEALQANGGDLDAAAGDLKFTELPAFSVNDVQNQTEIVKSLQQSKQLNAALFIDALTSIKAPGAFLEPQRAQQVFTLGQGMPLVIPVGYQLLYVANRVVPEKLDSNAEERQQLKDRLLLMKQSEEMNNFYQTLLEQSDTQLRLGTPYTGELPAEEE